MTEIKTTTEELLQFVYKNSEMGIVTIDQLLGIVKDKEFREQLETQRKEYGEICREAKELLNENGVDEKGLNAFQKVRSYLMIDMGTMADKSVSHIAEMMMIGSNMGVIKSLQNLRRNKDAEPKITALMERLHKTEENNIQQLKKFL